MISSSSVPAALEHRAQQHPDDVGFTFIDYEVDPAGFAESLTWSQLYVRVKAVAHELSQCGSVGDRAAILAPQSLDYVVAFLGALDAGMVAVPLSVPQGGTHDERVTSVLNDSAPVAVLTTSAVVDDVVSCVQSVPGTMPAIIETDALDFDTMPPLGGDSRSQAKIALLQYTSGSTRTPAGVVVTHRNMMVNLDQLITDMFAHHGGKPSPDTTIVSWLPFYHDMGLILGIYGPVVEGRHAVLMSPMAFLQKPARWMQAMARYPKTFTSGPNFAYDLAVRRISDEDMAGLDLSDVTGMMSGSERVHAATFKRFYERFSQFNLPENAVRPAYGLAEATVYVASLTPGQPVTTARFDYEKLSAGYAKRCEGKAGSELVCHGAPRSVTLRIVDPETCVENTEGKVGEIWVHGEGVAHGYWRNPQLTERVFGGRIVDPSPGTPAGPWLRTGDLGVLSDGELYITGRIKDLLIVDGRNHYPDDIEATVSEITRGRVAAISVPDDRTEQLVTIIELKQRGGSDKEVGNGLDTLKQQITSAISQSHSLRVSDVVLVPPGSIPITTSGKTRRSACVERYRLDQFPRLNSRV